MKKNTKRTYVAAALLVSGATLLSGCASISDLLSREITSHYDDSSSLAEADAALGWVPDDSTDITVRTPTDTDSGIAVISLTSESELPSTCVEAPRRSAPILTLEGRPDIYKASTVMVCGDWSVIASGDGWYGWTPNTGDAPE